MIEIRRTAHTIPGSDGTYSVQGFPEIFYSPTKSSVKVSNIAQCDLIGELAIHGAFSRYKVIYLARSDSVNVFHMKFAHHL